MTTLTELVLFNKEIPEDLGQRKILVKPEIHPYLVYRVLKDNFGLPNAKDFDEDKTQWSYLFQMGDCYIEIYDWKTLSCSITVYGKNNMQEVFQKLADDLNKLIEKESRKYIKEFNSKVKQPSARIVQNPYKLYFSTAESLKDLANELVQKSKEEKDIMDSFHLFYKQSDISRSSFLMYLSAFEGFLNLLYELYLKPEHREERIYQTINRAQIDVKLRLLPTYCNGFKVKTIDRNDERFQNYSRIVNLRNDFVHANFLKTEENQLIKEDNFEFVYLKYSDNLIPKDFGQISTMHIDIAKKYITDVIDLVLESMEKIYQDEFKQILEFEAIQLDVEYK